MLVACGEDPTTTSAAGAAAQSGGSGGHGAGGSSTGGAGPSGGGGSSSTGGGGAAPVVCDYETVAGVLVIEAEDLGLSEQWQVDASESGATGSGYIRWTGASQNNNPGVGVIEADLFLTQAGRYRVQWRSRIGMGSDTTEHNDTWMRFPDADDFYGLRIEGALESRRYPRPTCEDTTLMTMIASSPRLSEVHAGRPSSPEVGSAACPNGSTKDGWLKVYCSGAADWKWSTFTSDSDGHDIVLEAGQPGVYQLELSARADFHLIDRIVVHQEAVDDAVALDLALPSTPCL